MHSEPVERQAELPVSHSVPTFRLRHLLGFALVAGIVSWAYPKGRAAWRLHNQAVTYSDYALCMVGPTGPQLIREDPEGFRELARRRLVATMPETVPFKKCEPFAEKMPISHAALRVHNASAADFREYHNSPVSVSRTSIERLELSLQPLETLAELAWPFVRSGPGSLMKPSSHAKEAAHPRSPALPGIGTGLPASRHLYRSTAAFGDTMVVFLGSGANGQAMISKNGGVDWTKGGTRLVSEVRDRCVADEEGRAFTLSRMNDGQRIVLSHGPGAAPQVAILASGEQKVAGISCDKAALVAAIVEAPDSEGNRSVILRNCPFRRPCEDMRLPNTGKDKLYYPVDVARMGGDTIISRTLGGITRVSSSRDDGRTWMPWTIAYDAKVAQVDARSPFRLLVMADKLFLYSGSNRSTGYPLLVSRDHGASFRAPVATTGTDVLEKVAEKQ